MRLHKGIGSQVEHLNQSGAVVTQGADKNWLGINKWLVRGGGGQRGIGVADSSYRRGASHFVTWC